MCGASSVQSGLGVVRWLLKSVSSTCVAAAGSRKGRGLFRGAVPGTHLLRRSHQPISSCAQSSGKRRWGRGGRDRPGQAEESGWRSGLDRQTPLRSRWKGCRKKARESSWELSRKAPGHCKKGRERCNWGPERCRTGPGHCRRGKGRCKRLWLPEGNHSCSPRSCCSIRASGRHRRRLC